MKRLLLIALLVCPMATISANDPSIQQTWREINSYRVTSGAKAVIQGFLAAYAFGHGLNNGKLFMADASNIWDGNRKQGQWKLLADHGVVSGGMFYTSYLLACYAWANAKHALSIK